MQTPKPLIAAQEKGIGGWLILLAIHVCITPGQLLVSAGDSARDYYKPEVIDFIKSNPTWNAIKVCDVELTGILCVLSIASIPLFFLKHKRFPSWGIFIFACLACLALAKAVLVSRTNIPSEESSKIMTSCAIAMIKSGLWIAYLIKSTRVRNTFTRRVHLMPAAPFVSVT